MTEAEEAEVIETQRLVLCFGYLGDKFHGSQLQPDVRTVQGELEKALKKLEWLDSDGDGLGDNEDVFPFDKDAKYDTDGDGVPDSTDLFPRNSGMDSFVDIGWRIGLGLAVIGGILFMIQRRNTTTHDDSVWSQNGAESSPEDSFNRPAYAPSLDNFE